MITIKDVEHVAQLARLELTEEEKVKFSSQLSSVIEYMNQLNEVDTTGVEPMAHPYPLGNVMREDVVIFLRMLLKKKTATSKYRKSTKNRILNLKK